YPRSFVCTDRVTTEVFTLSLHDALPIFLCGRCDRDAVIPVGDGDDLMSPPQVDQRLGGDALRDDRLDIGLRRVDERREHAVRGLDRKSTRLNSSHEWISYAVFCLKKKHI